MTRGDVGAIIGRPITLWARFWPQLAAIYLLGLLAREGTIELAAWAGYDNKVWASVIMPLAGLARLGSYVVMFLVVRPALPALDVTTRTRVGRMDMFSAVIVPFFAVYLAWQLFREDWIAFETRAMKYRVGEAMMKAVAGGPPTELHPGTLPVSSVTWFLIATALIVRWGLNRVKDRLPAWMVPVRLYVDALWVFLVLSFSVNEGITVLTKPAQWIGQRRIMVWFGDVRAEAFSHFQPLEAAWNAVMWVLRTTFGGAAVPLMWLAVAGIVYGVGATTDWQSVLRRVAGKPAGELIDRSEAARTRLRGRWLKLPEYVRDKGRERATAQLGNFKVVTDAARVILHAGIPALALYVLGYIVLAWLDQTGSFYGAVLGEGYLFRGMAWLIGPHPQQFWAAFDYPLALLSHLVVEPLRICLIAATFSYCVEHLMRAAPKAAVAP
jgi:hypothetical protein